MTEFLGWAYALSARFKNRGVPAEDLRQVAAEALIKAARGFDPQRGTPFAGYATSTILGTLRRYFRDCTWCVHLPRGLQETAVSITAAREALTQTLGRSPTAADLAEHLGLTIEQVLDGIAAARGYSGVPFEFPGEEEPAAAARWDPGFELAENVQVLSPAIGHLSDRDRQLLAMRFKDEMTQTQIAEQLGISQMQVSRVLRRCLHRLRCELLATG